jgi:hypothetical protein
MQYFLGHVPFAQLSRNGPGDEKARIQSRQSGRRSGERLYQGFPLLFEDGPMELPPGTAVPVIRIALVALLAVKVSVDGHAVRGVEIVDQAVGAGPVSFGVPP